HGIDDAAKLDQEAVPGSLNDAAAVLGDHGIQEFVVMGIEPRQRTLLVGSHQAAVASDVAGEDGGKPTFYTTFGHKDCLDQFVHLKINVWSGLGSVYDVRFGSECDLIALSGDDASYPTPDIRRTPQRAPDLRAIPCCGLDLLPLQALS